MESTRISSKTTVFVFVFAFAFVFAFVCDLFRVDHTKIFKREGDCVRDIVLIGEGGI